MDKRTDAEVAASTRKYIEQLEGYRTPWFPEIEIKPGAKVVRLVAVSKSALAYRLVDISRQMGCALFLSEGRHAGMHD